MQAKRIDVVATARYFGMRASSSVMRNPRKKSSSRNGGKRVIISQKVIGKVEMKATEKLLLPPVILKSVTARRYAVIKLMHINQFRLLGHVDKPRYLAGCAPLSLYIKTTAGKIHIINFNRLEYTARKVRGAIDSSTA